ncbi:MAG: hypothetical protein GY821_05420 [Gammaproteobacteria bacterium]|nr:hypothetical protein [Gammaproteobacteria bacterium]
MATSQKKDNELEADISKRWQQFLYENKMLERLQKRFPEWYQEGINLAVNEKGMAARSVGARWYAQGYVIGRLEAIYTDDTKH